MRLFNFGFIILLVVVFLSQLALQIIDLTLILLQTFLVLACAEGGLALYLVQFINFLFYSLGEEEDDFVHFMDLVKFIEIGFSDANFLKKSAKFNFEFEDKFL